MRASGRRQAVDRGLNGRGNPSSCAPLNRRDELRDNLHFVVKPRVRVAMVNEGDAAETDWCAPAVGILLREA